MSLTRYDPWNIISQMNDLLDSSLRNKDSSSISTSRWTPAVDIRDEKDHYVIEADLPGVNKDAIEITMNNGILSIKGERKEEKKAEGTNFSRIERTYGTFHRQFTLPDTADSENIKASYEHGVLKLSIPKKEVARPKRITISDNNTGNKEYIEHQSNQTNQVAS